MEDIKELEKQFWASEFIKCAESFEYFLGKYYKTYNPEAKEISSLPVQYEFVKEVINELNYTDMENQNGLIILKSRQMMVSNIGMARCLWKILFSTMPYKMGVITRVAEQCFSTSDSLFGRIEFAYEHLPIQLKQTLKFNKKPMMITNANNGSQIIGYTTTRNSGRGSTLDEYWLDEAAALGSLAEGILASIAPATQRLYIVSTPKGKNYFYYMWTKALKGESRLKPLKLHWSRHPGRDQKWYERKTAELTSVVKAQEYDLSFEESQNGKVFRLELIKDDKDKSKDKIVNYTREQLRDMIINSKGEWKLVCGMDIGLADDTAIVIALYNQKKEKLIILHSISVNNHLPEAVVGLLKKELNKIIDIDESLILSFVTVHIDPSANSRSIATGRSAVQVYRELGLRILDDNRMLIKDGIADCQRWFSSDNITFMDSAVLFMDAIFDCHYPLTRDNVVKTYDRYADTQDGQCNFNVHLMDAGRYLLSNVRKSVTNKPGFEVIDNYTPSVTQRGYNKNNKWRK
jgi:hypothetical protein